MIESIVSQPLILCSTNINCDLQVFLSVFAFANVQNQFLFFIFFTVKTGLLALVLSISNQFLQIPGDYTL